MTGESDGAPPLPTPDDWASGARRGADQQSGKPPVLADDPAHSTAVESIRIPALLVQELIDAARAGFPNEACGIIAGDRPLAEGGQATRLHVLRNAAESPYRYLIDPDQQLATFLAIDDADEVAWGIFHSHITSPAMPSATDVGLAFYPDSLYVLCSLAGEVPEVRGWWIRDGQVTEVVLEVA